MNQPKSSSYNLVISGHLLPIPETLGASLLYHKLSKQAEDRIPMLEFLDNKYKGISMVYALRFTDNSLYVGSTSNFTRRILEHLEVKFSPAAKPVEGTKGKKLASIELVKEGDESAGKLYQLTMAAVYGKENVIGDIKINDTDYQEFKENVLKIRSDKKEELKT